MIRSNSQCKPSQILAPATWPRVEVKTGRISGSDGAERRTLMDTVLAIRVCGQVVQARGQTTAGLPLVVLS